MQAIIDELHESWVNGNRKYVIETVTTWRGAKATLGGALLYSVMSADERVTFLRMLRNRLDEE